MRNQPLSPQSDYSLLSSLDALSLDTANLSLSTTSASASGSRRSSTFSHLSLPDSARSRLSSGSQSTDSYEIILVPSPQERSNASQLSTPSLASLTKSAARRRREKRAVEQAPATSSSPQLAPASAVAGKRKHKTRRAGKRDQVRREKAQVRDALGIDGLEEEDSRVGTPRGLLSSPLDSGSIGGDDDEQDEDEVDGLSALGSDDSEVTASTSGREIEGSVMSTDDARSSIDSFLTDSSAFMSVQANKLRLWQALCVELGLVEIEDDLASPVTPSSRSRPRTRGPRSTSRSPTPTSSSRASTPRPRLPPLPTSLTQARKLLHEQGHVNLVDYFEAREHRVAGEGDPATFRHLLHPSASAMMRFSLKQKKLVALQDVKKDWLEPLLKDFGFKRARAAGA
ncbi:hypothetical protein P7C73_g3671, partial [Tremellales sp. Uapishka_1]